MRPGRLSARMMIGEPGPELAEAEGFDPRTRTGLSLSRPPEVRPVGQRLQDRGPLAFGRVHPFTPGFDVKVVVSTGPHATAPSSSSWLLHGPRRAGQPCNTSTPRRAAHPRTPDRDPATGRHNQDHAHLPLARRLSDLRIVQLARYRRRPAQPSPREREGLGPSPTEGASTKRRDGSAYELTCMGGHSM